jgi:hypothetical protein
LDHPLLVRVASGNVISCTSHLSNAVWYVQNIQFQSDLKIIPLRNYDLILGMDWLGQYSLMHVDWKHKWLSIEYQGQPIAIHGLQPLVPSGALLQVRQVEVMTVPSPEFYHLSESDMPTSVHQLLCSYQSLFKEPTILPPSRFCDHTIPLIPGAHPVNMRPYRFSPAMKDEVETQVKDMLRSGLIQPRSSAFSSPVILVKKKDQSWRFCADYRHLNALTVKTKYLIPMIDELLDELSGASWFSILDLRAGFHQILLKAGEEHKTAFQTHMGHYEFCVMAFDLTGAPGTFQRAMNQTLSPLLRNCALVFFDDILIYSATLEAIFTI